VHFGLCADGRSLAVERRFPDVGRESIRVFAAHAALDLVRRHLPAPAALDRD
jgi:nicotinamide mononucleotide (NMN) deamidase PncC